MDIRYPRVFTGKFASVEDSLNVMTCACRSFFFPEFLDAVHCLQFLEGVMHGHQLSVEMLYGT